MKSQRPTPLRSDLRSAFRVDIFATEAEARACWESVKDLPGVRGTVYVTDAGEWAVHWRDQDAWRARA